MHHCPESPNYLVLMCNILKLINPGELLHVSSTRWGCFTSTCSRTGKDVQTYVTEAANPALLTDALPGLGTAAVQTPRERNTLITKSTLPTWLTPERDKTHDRDTVYF